LPTTVASAPPVMPTRPSAQGTPPAPRPPAHGPLRNLGGGAGPARPGDGPAPGGGSPTRRPPLLGRGRAGPGYGVVRSAAPVAPPSLRKGDAQRPVAPKGPQKLANIPQHLMDR